MKNIIKSIILGTLLFQLPLLASELPTRDGGKFGTISKSTTTKKLRKTSRGCRPYMQNALRVQSSNYGIFGRYKVYGYTTTYKCGRPYPAQLMYTKLYAYIPGHGWSNLCNQARSGRYHFKASCSYRWFNSAKPKGAYGWFAARVDGQELRAARRR